MIQKILSISTLLIASIILLAHEVIPHHTHDDHLCIEHNACTNDHQHDSHPTNHPTDKEDQCCLLSNLHILIPGNQLNHIFYSFYGKEEKPNNDHLLFLPEFYHEFHSIFSPLSFRQNPSLEHHLLSYANQVPGLRAPPCPIA